VGVAGIDRRGDLHHFQTTPGAPIGPESGLPVLVQIGSKMNQE